VFVLDYNGPGGPPDPHPIVLRGVYCLDSDTLQIGYGGGSDFPTRLSDEHGLISFAREAGKLPEAKQPSRTQPIHDDTLGTLEWEDNFGWYEGTVQMDSTVVKLRLPADTTDATVNRAKSIVRHQDHFYRLASVAAANGLLDIRNSTWRRANEGELGVEGFIARIRLESMVFHATGAVTFHFNDGGLFLGHSIEVQLDAGDNCVGVDIPG
jgi:hypothetical protein